MGGLYWGIIFSTAVRTYLKGNILFLGFYLGSVSTMCRIVNPMMYDSVVYDYLKVICTKWAKDFGIHPWDLTHWAHNSRGGCDKEGPQGTCCSVFPILCGSRGPFRREAWDWGSSALVLNPFSQLSDFYLSVLGKEGVFISLQCLCSIHWIMPQEAEILKGQLHQLSQVIASWRTEVGRYSILRAIWSEIRNIYYVFRFKHETQTSFMDGMNGMCLLSAESPLIWKPEAYLKPLS